MNIKQKLFVALACVPIATYFASGNGPLISVAIGLAVGYAVASVIMHDEIKLIERYAPTANALSEAAAALRRVF